MTLEYSHNRHIKILALLLIVCLLVSFCFSFKADAAGAGVAAALYAVGGAAVVGSILHAMGIFHGTAHTDWDSLVTAVLGHLGDLGYVTADGKIKLSVLGAGVTMIPGAIISAVRDFVSSGDSPAISVSSSASPDELSQIDSSTKYSYYFFVSFKTIYRKYILASNTPIYYSVSGDTLVASCSGSLYMCTKDSETGFYSSFGYISSSSYTFFAPNCIYSGGTYGDVHSTTASTSKDLNVSGIPDTFSPSAQPDVIYPGWATHSENVDTNIDVVADVDTGAIDGVITADKYYPIGIPDLGTSIYDQTQAGAQTGTKEDVIASEADAVKDSTKEDADSFAIGPMSDYTMQLKDFFPFCIPFDIYDMLNCLAAEPEAPSFDWKIPVLGQDNIVHVDLVQFNTVASILRTMELLAFCVGLAFVTKHLIQGGAG